MYPKQKLVPAKTKEPFRCIYSWGNSFVSAKLDFSRETGYLNCQSCGAEFQHKITVNQSCAADVEAALLAGDKFKLVSAKQDPTHA